MTGGGITHMNQGRLVPRGDWRYLHTERRAGPLSLPDLVVQPADHEPKSPRFLA
jgi:hypothetical protein